MITKDEYIAYDNDLVRQVNNTATGADIHDVSAFLSGYLNYHYSYSFYYDHLDEYNDDYVEAKNKLEFFERCLRSYLVTKRIYYSETLVRNAMMEEGKIKGV